MKTRRPPVLLIALAVAALVPTALTLAGGREGETCVSNLFRLDTCGPGYACRLASSCVSLWCEGRCFQQCKTDADCPSERFCAGGLNASTDICWH